MSEVYAVMDQQSWGLAMGRAAAGKPSCKSYMGSIKQPVELYGEGARATSIKELKKTSKQCRGSSKSDARVV